MLKSRELGAYRHPRNSGDGAVFADDGSEYVHVPFFRIDGGRRSWHNESWRVEKRWKLVSLGFVLGRTRAAMFGQSMKVGY